MSPLKLKEKGSFLWGGSLILGFLLTSLIPQNALAAEQIFRLHLNTEPVSLKPWEQRNSSAGYLLAQVHGTLLKYKNGALTPSLAKRCDFKNPLKIDCEISSEAKFSDGSKITAEHFKTSWMEFLNPKNNAIHASILFGIKGAEEYFKGSTKAVSVGITAQKNHLIIELAKPDPDFLYSLTSPLLAPLKSFEFPELKKSHGWITSGSFKISSWEPQKKITLEHIKNSKLKVEFLFVGEDSTALNLYEKGELTFLRRLPTLFIQKFKSRSDFYQIPQSRLDYIGFGPELKGFPLLREALVKALDYKEITSLLASKGTFGCPGISMSVQKTQACYSFDLSRAKSALSEYQALTKKLPRLTFAFSKQGGDDHKMVAEWLQSQWKKNLQLDVELKSSENKIFLEDLKQSPPSIFRKGVNPERPTCLSAVENFDLDSVDNYLKLDPKSDPEFFKALEKLKPSKKPLSLEKKQAACSQAIEALNSNYRWIPTGPIHFTVLVKDAWTGWDLNELNQLDLADLKMRH